MAALWHAVLCAWLAVGVTSGAVEAEGERWARVGTLAHTHAFEALVAAHHGHDEAAFARAQREELALRAAMGRVQQTAHELQASAVLGADGVDAATWAHVQDRLRTMFGEESVRPHRVGVTLVFAEARDTHKVEEVMQWAEVSAVAPWLAAHKLSPEFAVDVCGSHARSDGSVQLSVTTMPMTATQVIEFAAELQAHVDADDPKHYVSLEARRDSSVFHDYDRLPESALQVPSAFQVRERSVRVEVRCEVAGEVAAHVAEHRQVRWVEPRGVIMPMNKWAAGITQAAQVDNHFIWNQTLNGTGQIVGVCDTGLDASHCFFYDPDVPTPYNITTDAHRKIVTYIPYVNKQDYNSGHGSHVSGSVLGQVYNLDDNYTEVEEFNGMAFGAKVAFFDAGNQEGELFLPSNVDTQLFDQLLAAGAHIITNSWGHGDGDSHTYDSMAQHADQFMWDNPSALLLFSAGNDGADGAGTAHSPSTAKSVCTCGCTLNSVQSWATFSDNTDPSLYNYQNMAYFSSQGPTADGRLKPDVSAPGYYTESTDANAGVDGPFHCDTSLKAGTSMSTPTTAGNTALIREYLTSGYYPTGVETAEDGFVPSGSLMKAMLIHSADAMDGQLDVNGTLKTLGAPPDNIQGYGRIELDNVLLFAGQNDDWYSLFLVGSSDPLDGDLYASLNSTGDVDQYVVSVSDTVTRSLKITLTWSDYPLVTGMTNGSLSNDLTLMVQNETTAWFVNDTQNPVNQVVVSDPQPNSNYTISVMADVILVPSQPYSLVVSGNIQNNIDYVPQPEREDDFTPSGDDAVATDDDDTDDKNNSKDDDDDDDDSNGLSDGAVAGITVGVLAGGGGLLAAGYIYSKRQRGDDSTPYGAMS